MPAAIHLEVQIGPDVAGRGVGRALSAVLPSPLGANITAGGGVGLSFWLLEVYLHFRADS